MALKIDFNKIVKKMGTIAYVQSCIANIEAISDIPVDNVALQNFLEQSCSMYVFQHILLQMIKFKSTNISSRCQKLKVYVQS